MRTLCSSRTTSLLLSVFSKRSVTSIESSYQQQQLGYRGTFPNVSSTIIHRQCRASILTQMLKRSINLSSSYRLASGNQSKQSQSYEEEGEETFPAEEDLDQTKPYVIYEGALTNQMKRVKIISLMTSSMGLVMQPMILSNSDTPMAATVAVLGMVGFFTYVTPILIHQLAKRYVTEIIYDPQQEVYTAATYSFFLRRRETIFKKDDVTVPDAPGPLISMLVNSKDGKKTGLFVALESFIYPVHYGKMMGYEKPLDLHLAVEAVVKEKQKNKLQKDADSANKS